MGFRVVATDLDGTLLRSDGSVSERTVRALQAAEAAGMMVLVATGRPPRWIGPVAAELGHTGLAVCANGAVVFDLHSEHIVQTTPMTREVVVKVTDIVRAALPDVAFAVETIDRGFHYELDYPALAKDVEQATKIANIRDAAADDIVKLLIRHRGMDPDGLLTAARAVAGDLVELTHSSRNGLLEVSAQGVTKASTLTHIVESHGYDRSEVVAFGDMPNDLPMLAWAGRSYAMANAHPDVLAATSLVAPGNDDDGVAIVIERLLDRSTT